MNLLHSQIAFEQQQPFPVYYDFLPYFTFRVLWTDTEVWVVSQEMSEFSFNSGSLTSTASWFPCLVLLDSGFFCTVEALVAHDFTSCWHRERVTWECRIDSESVQLQFILQTSFILRACVYRFVFFSFLQTSYLL